jgi:hypothetical protein
MPEEAAKEYNSKQERESLKPNNPHHPWDFSSWPQ